MTVVTITDNFVDRVGAEGFYDIKRHTDLACRVFWVVLVIIAWILAFYQCAVYVIKFLDYGKTTTFELQYSSYMPFPAVTFCNLNPIKRSNVEKQFGENFNATLKKSLAEEPQNRYRRQAPPPPTTSKPIEPLSVTNSQSSSPDPGPVGAYAESSTMSPQQQKEAFWAKQKPPDPNTPPLQPAQGDVGNVVAYYVEQESVLASNDEMVSEIIMQQSFYSELYSTPPHEKIYAGHQIWDMMVECIWKQQQCSPSDFSSFFHSTNGNCYTFNSGWMNYTDSNLSYYKTVKNVSSTGPESGLTLILYSESNDYIPAITSSNGFKVVIHDQAEIPQPDSAGFIASSGYYNAYKLKLMELKRLGYPYNYACGSGLPYPMAEAKLLWPTAGYSQAACMKFLLQKSLWQNCSCIMASVWFYQGLEPCDTSNQLHYTCSSRIMEQFTNNTNSFVTNNCPTACDEKDFEISTSIASWPSISYSKFLQSTYSDRHSDVADLFTGNDEEALKAVRRNVAKIQVFYDKLSFSTVTESPEYPFTQMLGDVGGAVGLWAGVSILSMIQICEFIMELCKYNCKGEKDDVPVEQTRRGPDRPESSVPVGAPKAETLPKSFL